MRTVACRACGTLPLEPVLDLGPTPLANRLRTCEQLSEPEPVYPLELAFCPGCALLQLTVSVPPEELFRDYPYFSSYSDTMLRHAAAAAERLIERERLGPGSLVVELASNDGYLLRNFVDRGIPVLGIEPARNVAAVARAAGIPTREEFFGLDLARRLAAEGVRADVVAANNVLAHVPDLNGVVGGVRLLLKEGGVFVIETPYLRSLLEGLEFDTIYHEHLFYYSLHSLSRLLAAHGLAVVDVEEIPIHGGSLRVEARPGATHSLSRAASSMLEEERRWGVDRPDPYRALGERAAHWREGFRRTLDGLRASGRRIAAYGAAAKGCTLLHFAGVGPETLEFVVDRSPHKQGRYFPGAGLPILPPAALIERGVDVALLLAWNLAGEVAEQQREFLRRGGRFLLPLPEPRFLEPAGIGGATS